MTGNMAKRFSELRAKMSPEALEKAARLSQANMKERVVYYMVVEDVQTVANECLNRSLSDDEIAMIEDAIAERVDWFGAIEGAILDKIER